MSAVRLHDLVAAHGGVAFALDVDGESVRRLSGADAELRLAPPDVHLDSAGCGPGDLFAALPGLRVDGWSFVEDALARGAGAVLAPAEHSLDELRARLVGRAAAFRAGSPPPVVWLHPRARLTAGLAAADVHRRPSESLRVAAVTGTNGKTSVCHMARHVLRAAGVAVGALGTAGHSILGPDGPMLLGAAHTTADAPSLQRLLRRHQAGGGTAVVMEASSHALDQERLAGTTLAAAGFTNLSRDHLDYHGTMERYRAAKAALFRQLRPGAPAVVLGDGPDAAAMVASARDAGARVVRARVEAEGDLVARDVETTARGLRFTLEGEGLVPARVTLPLPGRHNLENALVAIGLARAVGAHGDAVHAALETLPAPPGRLEAVPRPPSAADDLPRVFVDYAHTPDALERVLAALREDQDARGGGRIVCVFGAGGDRDRGKRAPMGAAVARLADLAVVTSDNPRSEDPADIAADVLEGVDAAGGRRVVELDRRAAIALAVAEAGPGDVVLIAGKGHENTQTTARGSEPFDDRVVAAEVLRGGAAAGEEVRA